MKLLKAIKINFINMLFAKEKYIKKKDKKLNST